VGVRGGYEGIRGWYEDVRAEYRYGIRPYGAYDTALRPYGPTGPTDARAEYGPTGIWALRAQKLPAFAGATSDSFVHTDGMAHGAGASLANMRSAATFMPRRLRRAAYESCHFQVVNKFNMFN
jgi:hypothetical protein